MGNLPQPDSENAQDELEGWNFRLGAWLPWLPLLWLGINSVGLMQGFLDGLLPLAIYVLISFPIGIAVCSYYRKDFLGFVIAGTILFGGPPIGLAYRNYESNRWSDKQQTARSHLAHYCKEYAGEKIYRKVADVEGVLQMDVQPSHSKRGQYDAHSPWARMQRSVSASALKLLALSGRSGYLFVEYNARSDMPGPPYQRSFLVYKNDLDDLSGKPYDPSRQEVFHIAFQSVDLVESRYGWRIEDLTTTEMRDHWISGGTLQIMDLESDELLAEHTGFFMGKGAIERGKSWAQAKYPITDICNGSYRLESFIRKVLVPPKTLPSKERLDSLKT